MKTWNDYKDYVKNIDPENKKDSVARIESFKATPNLDTLIRIMQSLGLKLTIAQADR